MNINHLRRIAERSPHPRYKHCSLILAGSRVVAWGYNHDGIHSESSAIRKLKQIFRNTSIPRNLSMINLMIKTTSNRFGTSLPCSKCAEELKANNIRKVCFYQFGVGFVEIKYDS